MQNGITGHGEWQNVTLCQYCMADLDAFKKLSLVPFTLLMYNNRLLDLFLIFNRKMGNVLLISKPYGTHLPIRPILRRT